MLGKRRHGVEDSASLHIALQDATCKAGSIVAGCVNFRGHTILNVDSVTITIIGHCKSIVVRMIGQGVFYYYGNALLISENKCLFNGPNPLRPEHSWDFQFTLPTHCTAREQDPFHLNPYQTPGIWKVEPDQNLPPVFSEVYHGFPSRPDGSGSITYELKAKLSINRRSGSRYSKDLEVTKVLDFFTTREEEHPDSQMSSLSQDFKRYSIALNPGHEDVRLRFKERLKSVRRSKLPMARFTLGLNYPQVAICDKTIPLTLSIDHDFSSSSAVAPPMVYLRTCSVRLLALTWIRCRASSIFHTNLGELYWEKKHHIDSCKFPGKGPPALVGAPPVSEHMDLGDLMQLKLPGGQVPIFSTFNIQRTYRLAVKVTIECAQKSFHAEFLTGSMTLLSAVCDTETRECVGQGES